MVTIPLCVHFSYNIWFSVTQQEFQFLHFIHQTPLWINAQFISVSTYPSFPVGMCVTIFFTLKVMILSSVTLPVLGALSSWATFLLFRLPLLSVYSPCKDFQSSLSLFSWAPSLKFLSVASDGPKTISSLIQVKATPREKSSIHKCLHWVMYP